MNPESNESFFLLCLQEQLVVVHFLIFHLNHQVIQSVLFHVLQNSRFLVLSEIEFQYDFRTNGVLTF